MNCDGTSGPPQAQGHRAAFTNNCKTDPLCSNLGFPLCNRTLPHWEWLYISHTSPKSQVAPAQPFLSPPNRPSVSTGLISGQQGNETICSWISHLNQPEAENAAPVGTLKVRFLPPFQNTSIRPGSSIISTVDILCRYSPDSTDQKCKLRKPRRAKIPHSKSSWRVCARPGPQKGVN